MMMMTVLFSFSNWNWRLVFHGFSFVLITVVCFFCPTDCQNLFGIIYRCPQEMKEKLLMFRLVGDEINKQEWLQKLTTGLANTACTADTVCTVFTPLTATARNTLETRRELQPKYVPQSGIVTRDAPVRRRRWRDREKSKRLRLAKQEQCTCLTLFCSFLCRRCGLQPFAEGVNTRQRLPFSFPELWYSLLEINSINICQHLTNWTSWNKHDKVWSSANSPFKWCFRSPSPSTLLKLPIG